MVSSKKIQVIFLDENKIKQIKSETNRLISLQIPGNLDLELVSTHGNISDALAIISPIHCDKNVDLNIEVSGDVGSAGTLITAGGKIGNREAKFGTIFKLCENGPYPADTPVSSLSVNDKIIFNTLVALTKKGSIILPLLLKGTSISADEAKKCKIIDKVGKFQSKYLTQKKIAKANQENFVTSNQFVQTPANANQNNTVNHIPQNIPINTPVTTDQISPIQIGGSNQNPPAPVNQNPPVQNSQVQNPPLQNQQYAPATNNTIPPIPKKRGRKKTTV